METDVQLPEKILVIANKPLHINDLSVKVNALSQRPVSQTVYGMDSE
jgi:hypothetical protein